MVLCALKGSQDSPVMEDKTLKIYARHVVRIGREPRHSFAVTIPRKICRTLQIEKGSVLYFRLAGNAFVASKEKPVIAMAEPTITRENEPKKEKGDVTVAGISLADLQY